MQVKRIRVEATSAMRQLLPHYIDSAGEAVSNAAGPVPDVFLAAMSDGTFEVQYFGTHDAYDGVIFEDLTWDEAVAHVVAFKLKYGVS